MSSRIDSEEELIGRFLRPLSQGLAGAFDLADDCARLGVPSGEELVVTCDAVAEGVHFFADDAPEDIAWKALAVNVSDLAGKAATPLAYVMALSFPEPPLRAWMTRFAEGLALAQEAMGLQLAGGDTDRRPGPLSITITAFGSAPGALSLARARARPGDVVYVSGTIGDAALGLVQRQDPPRAGTWALAEDETAHLARRYLRPEPRLGLATAIRAAATATLDVSDGLVKDLERLAAASGTGSRIEAARVPLSSAARRAAVRDPQALASVLTGGDDYEILAAVAPERATEFERLAGEAAIPVAAIGRVTTGLEVVLRDAAGEVMTFPHTGWSHF